MEDYKAVPFTLQRDHRRVGTNETPRTSAAPKKKGGPSSPPSKKQKKSISQQRTKILEKP